jgi:DNA polymerase-3 subunit gamma/tau
VEYANLLRHWNEYADLKKQAGDMNHFIIFANRKITLREDLTILFEVDNQLQLDILKELRGDVLEYLRKKVSNSTLQLEATITQTEAKTLLYTNNDKYNYLLEHYPILDEFRRRFGLELS